MVPLKWDEEVDLASDVPSDAPSDIPSFAPITGEAKGGPEAVSFFDKPAESETPSDIPSDTPSVAPVEAEVDEQVDDPSGPVSVFEKPVEIEENSTEDINDEPEGIDVNLCATNDFLPFVLPSDTVSLYTYTLSAGEAAIDITADVVFNVSSYCEYMIYEYSLTDPHTYDTPTDWINAAVLYFGGIPRVLNGAALTGLAAPAASEISVVQLGNVIFDVEVSASSESVNGEEPLAFGFPLETQAMRFQMFLLSILDSAPGIFLKSDVVSCGSGPLCVKLDEDICFYNPRREKLGLLEDGGATTYYDNSLQWFNHCAESLGCTYVYGNEQLLYFGVPSVSVVGTTFQFGRPDVDPVEWECYDVQAAHALVDFIEMAAKDPFNPLRVGGIFQNSEELN